MERCGWSQVSNPHLRFIAGLMIELPPNEHSISVGHGSLVAFALCPLQVYLALPP